MTRHYRYQGIVGHRFTPEVTPTLTSHYEAPPLTEAEHIAARLIAAPHERPVTVRRFSWEEPNG